MSGIRKKRVGRDQSVQRRHPPCLANDAERLLSSHCGYPPQKSGALVEAPRPPSLDIGLRSRHFLLRSEAEVWELLEPEPPFAGSFKPYEVREEFGA